MDEQKSLSINTIARSPLIWLALLAALFYCSWPLGYLLNPMVAHHAMASELESARQPYNWLFVGLDVAAGCALLVGGIIQLVRSRSNLLRLGIVGYMVFGLLVVVAAAVPFNCNSMAGSCGGAADRLSLMVHGAASIASVVCLLASLIIALRLFAQHHASRWLQLALMAFLAVWGILGLAALATIDNNRRDENLVQYAFITVCSVTILLSVIITEYLLGLSPKE